MKKFMDRRTDGHQTSLHTVKHIFGIYFILVLLAINAKKRQNKNPPIDSISNDCLYSVRCI